MKKIELSKDDYKDIKYIIEISKAIHNIYEELLNLEIKGLKNSKQYKDLFLKLQALINIENDKLINLIQYGTKIDALMQYLISLINEFKPDPILIAISNDKENYPVKRLIFKLRYFNMILPSLYTENNPNLSSLFDLELYFKSTQEEIIRDIKTVSNLIESFDTDVFTFFLTMLQAKIKSPFFIGSKQELIKAKYNFSYIFPSFERVAAYYSMDAPKDIYLYRELMTDLLQHFNQAHLEGLRHNTEVLYAGVAEDETERLLNLKSDDYSNPKIQVEAMMSEIYLRSIFKVLPTDLINELTDNFHSSYENGTFPYSEYKKSIELVTSAYRLRKKDNIKTLTVTLKG